MNKELTETSIGLSDKVPENISKNVATGVQVNFSTPFRMEELLELL